MAYLKYEENNLLKHTEMSVFPQFYSFRESLTAGTILI